MQPKALNDHLQDKSYIGGYVPSQADITEFNALGCCPCGEKFPYACRWYCHIASFNVAQKARCELKPCCFLLSPHLSLSLPLLTSPSSARSLAPVSSSFCPVSSHASTFLVAARYLNDCFLQPSWRRIRSRPSCTSQGCCRRYVPTHYHPVAPPSSLVLKYYLSNIIWLPRA